jgi:hypothetical protein
MILLLFLFPPAWPVLLIILIIYLANSHSDGVVQLQRWFEEGKSQGYTYMLTGDDRLSGMTRMYVPSSRSVSEAIASFDSLPGRRCGSVYDLRKDRDRQILLRHVNSPTEISTDVESFIGRPSA